MIGFGERTVKTEIKNDLIEEILKKTSERQAKKSFIFSSSSSNLTQQRSPIIPYDSMRKMYIQNEWVRAIVDRTVNKIVSFKPTISIANDDKKENSQLKKQVDIANELLKNPNKTKESFFQLRKKILRDILIYDAAGLLKKMSSRGGEDDPLGRGNKLLKVSGLELLTVAGDTIYLNVDNHGKFKDLDKAYYQQTNLGDDVINFSADKMTYYLDNPSSGYAYGISPLETLIMVVTSELYASTYNRDFFKNDATPKLGILFDDMGVNPNDKLKRYRKFWEKELKGQPHKPYFAGTEEGKVRIEKIGLSNNEMQFIEYSHWLLTKIMAVYKCQPFVLGDIIKTTGKLNSEQQSKQWYEDAIKPMLELEMYYFNTEILWPKSGLGFPELIYKYAEAEFNLNDKEERDKNQIEDGRITINEWRKERGLDPVDWGNAPWYGANEIQPTEPIEKRKDFVKTDSGDKLTFCKHCGSYHTKEQLELIKKKMKNHTHGFLKTK